MEHGERLDIALVRRGLADSRERAQGLILAGLVTVAGQTAHRASSRIAPDMTISICGPDHPFVSRGGLKLAAALKQFVIDPSGMTAVDIGASTGGFTDCLLQCGAAKVYAVDVGHGQLDWKLRTDPRVIVLEKLNARFLSREHIPELVDLCMIDVSFISLTLILPKAFGLITPNGVTLALIKPQFELERGDVGRGGIVCDPEL